MPIYEYRCIRCDNLFDKLQNPDDDEPVCPVCGSEVMRIFSPIGLHFKGPGFHCNDYGKFKSKNKNSIQENIMEEDQIHTTDEMDFDWRNDSIEIARDFFIVYGALALIRDVIRFACRR